MSVSKLKKVVESIEAKGSIDEGDALLALSAAMDDGVSFGPLGHAPFSDGINPTEANLLYDRLMKAKNLTRAPGVNVVLAAGLATGVGMNLAVGAPASFVRRAVESPAMKDAARRATENPVVAIGGGALVTYGIKKFFGI
jgi:hypothetical protein